MDVKTKKFIESMAGQFQAGRQIVAPLKDTINHREWIFSTNAVERDIDSFCAEATRWFGEDFNEEEFREVAFANQTITRNCAKAILA